MTLWSCGTRRRKRRGRARWWGLPPVACRGTSPRWGGVDPSWYHTVQGLLRWRDLCQVPENLRRIRRLCLDHCPVVLQVGVLHTPVPISVFGSVSVSIHESQTRIADRTRAPCFLSGVVGFMLCSTKGPKVDFKNPINPLDPNSLGVAKRPAMFYNSEVSELAFQFSRLL